MRNSYRATGRKTTTLPSILTSCPTYAGIRNEVLWDEAREPDYRRILSQGPLNSCSGAPPLVINQCFVRRLMSTRSTTDPGFQGAVIRSGRAMNGVTLLQYSSYNFKAVTLGEITTLDHAQNAANKRKFVPDNAISSKFGKPSTYQFMSGIEKRKKKKALEVAARILIAVIGFAVSVGLIVTGDPAGGPMAAKEEEVLATMMLGDDASLKTLYKPQARPL
ncbi:hypothetical protein V8E54_005679 [Elaphomyces granulatus]